MKTKFLIIYFLTLFNSAFSQTDCQTATVLCSDQTLSGNSFGFGNQELNSTNRGCIASNERQSSWYVLNILQGGTLTFLINPVNGTDDYDFAIWNYNNCNINTAPIRCSYASGGGSTGLSTTANDVSENSLGNRFVRFMNVNTNDTYVLLVNNYTRSSSPFQMSFGGSAVLGCFILGPKITINAFENVDKNLISVYLEQNYQAKLEYSVDCVSWDFLANVTELDFVYNHKPTSLYTYYRVVMNNDVSEVVAVENKNYTNIQIIEYYNILGEPVDKYYDGVKIVKFSNGVYKMLR